MTVRTETVSTYLQSDHRRLDALLDECRRLVEAGDMTRAAGLFDQFQEGLVRHIRIEEDLLFPEFEKAAGMGRDSGPTGVMLSEHVEIQRLMEEIHEALAATPPAREAFEPLRSALLALLSEHNTKEERILYPMSDRMIDPERLAGLLRDMKDF